MKLSDLPADLLAERLCVAEGRIAEGSPLRGATLVQSGLRRKHQVHVLALHGPTEGEVKDLRRRQLATGDRLLLQGERAMLEDVARLGLVSELRFVSA